MVSRTHAVPGQREVLTDRAEVRQEALRAPRVTETLHLTLTPTRRLMAVLRAVIDPGRGLHEDVLHAGQLRHLGSCRRIAAQLVGDNLPGQLGTSATSF